MVMTTASPVQESPIQQLDQSIVFFFLKEYFIWKWDDTEISSLFSYYNFLT